MSTASPPVHYTPDDLLRMPDGDRFELVDGQLVEHTMGKLAVFVAGRIFELLAPYCKSRGLGWVLPEGATYRCFPDESNKVRKADLSFISAARISMEVIASPGHFELAPDLVVEVVSPTDIAYEVDRKVQEYLQAGVRLVWVVNPQVQTVEVHRPQATGTILHENDVLEGETVIPGFHCKIAELFQPPEFARKPV